MDIKAIKILSHYREKIENRLFDEYDILGFLIFIRSYIHSKVNIYKYIIEFADLIAHRERDRGITMNNISAAINNNYECIENTNLIKGYNGIKEKDWNNEWELIGEEFNINIDKNIIREITLCIFSLSQKSEFSNTKGEKGIIEFDALPEGAIGLLTTEGYKNSLFICLAKYSGYKVNEKYSKFPMETIVYTERINGNLVLKTEDEIVV